MKRNDYISWDDYFMGVAILSSKRSKDPQTQVGACIVNNEKRIIGIGYNGFPMGLSDDIFPWKKEGIESETKYPYVVHAETNAILNSVKKLKDCSIYVTLFPCSGCMKLLIQSQISEIVYLEDRYLNKDDIPQDYIASKKMAQYANIKIRNYKVNFNIEIK